MSVPLNHSRGRGNHTYHLLSHWQISLFLLHIASVQSVWFSQYLAIASRNGTRGRFLKMRGYTGWSDHCGWMTKPRFTLFFKWSGPIHNKGQSRSGQQPVGHRVMSVAVSKVAVTDTQRILPYRERTVWQGALHLPELALEHTWRFSGCAKKRLGHTTCLLTHSGRMTQICVFTLQLCKTDEANCVFNTRLFSLHNTLNYSIHRTCLRMVLLTDVYRNLTSLWIKL